MIKPIRRIASVVVAALATASAVSAQDKPPTVVSAPLKVQVVIARYQGEKKISSLPYTLSLSSDRPGAFGASLRMGARIPLAMIAGQIGPVQYQDVGTNIDCQATALDDGRFRIQLTIDDSSVYPGDKAPSDGAVGSPSFRSFRAVDAMFLKDGQTAPLTAATDKVTGETMRVDVTLTVVK